VASARSGLPPATVANAFIAESLGRRI